jgi:hypothetical protein
MSRVEPDPNRWKALGDARGRRTVFMIGVGLFVSAAQGRCRRVSPDPLRVPAMAIIGDPARYRRQQRRRAIVGWLGGLAAIALLVLLIALGGDEDHGGETISVPYGETMSSAQYDEIEAGESRADVLDRLDKTGRPESLTEGYVLVLFPPPADDVSCSYWEFSDEPEIFARLCFDRDDGDLASKLSHNVHRAGEAQGTIA